MAERLKAYKHAPGSFILRLLVSLSAVVTVLVLIYIIAYILIHGIPYLSPDFFSLQYTSDNCSVVPSIINTLIMSVLSLCIVIPFGIGSAVYLAEYAKSGSRLVKIISLTAETLSGIPSIVYGLFGMLFFVETLKLGNSILSGAFTLSIMILPVVLRTTEEALKAIPQSYREGSFGLGAGKLRTIFRIVIPAAMPGILAGIILAIGRVVSETAAILYTSGTVAKVPENLMRSGRTIAVHMYTLSSEGMHINQAYAAAVVLLALVFLINVFSSAVAKKISKV